MSAHARARIALHVALIAVAACATPPRGFKAASTAPNAPSDMIAETEIRNANVTTAYEAVQRLRPTFLSWTRASTPSEQRIVVVDGIQMGGLDALRMIPADAIQEVRLFRPTHSVGPYQAMTAAGAILITTRVGPRR